MKWKKWKEKKYTDPYTKCSVLYEH